MQLEKFENMTVRECMSFLKNLPSEVDWENQIHGCDHFLVAAMKHILRITVETEKMPPASIEEQKKEIVELTKKMLDIANPDWREHGDFRFSEHK